MINYTTPTITLTVEGVNISAFDIFVTLEQGKTELTKTGAELTISTETVGQITNTIISFMLSQKESASFDYSRYVDVQVNWFNNGTRNATEIERIEVMRNLLDRVIE